MTDNTLLVAKLSVILLISGGVHRSLRAPFAPFSGVLDFLGVIPGYGAIMAAVFFGASALLLFNRAVRHSSLVAGAIVLLGQAGSMPAYRSHAAFAGCVLILCGLQAERVRPTFLRWLVVAVLGATTLGNLLSLDWITGATVQLWLAGGLVHPAVLFLSRAVPSPAWPGILSWLMILGPVCLVSGLLIPYRSRLLILTGAGFLLATLVVANSAETAAFIIMIGVAMIAFLDWPQHLLRVTWPRACGLPLWLRIVLDKRDWDNRIDWLMPPDPDGILLVEIDDRQFAGAQGLTTLLLYSPVFHLATVGALWITHLALPATAASLAQLAIGAPLLMVFLRPKYLQMRASVQRSMQGD